MFTFAGYVARSRIYKCGLCDGERSECLGVYAREDHVAGGQRYTYARDWPQGEGLRHEVERVPEPFCFSCIQELGFTTFEDHGVRPFEPHNRIIERGSLKRDGTSRIIPQSSAQVLAAFAQKPSSRQDLDVQAMLDELGGGDEQ